jgi:hypothetical protein
MASRIDKLFFSSNAYINNKAINKNLDRCASTQKDCIQKFERKNYKNERQHILGQYL